MRVLWHQAEPMSVRAVMEDLNSGDRSLAYTTVMTVMENLHRKGFLTRERLGRAWLYCASQSREQHTAALMGEALASGADREGTLLRFVEAMSLPDLERLQGLIEELLPRSQPGAEE